VPWGVVSLIIFPNASPVQLGVEGLDWIFVTPAHLPLTMMFCVLLMPFPFDINVLLLVLFPLPISRALSAFNTSARLLDEPNTVPEAIMVMASGTRFTKEMFIGIEINHPVFLRLQMDIEVAVQKSVARSASV
jgi:hypothetical protein